MRKQRGPMQRRQTLAATERLGAWVDRELAGCEFRDERLGKRFRSLLARLAGSPGESIPLACQDWTNTKAAYRFLDNARVSEAQILAGHFLATRDRVAATDGPILVLHDTTEFSFKREDIKAVGITYKGVTGANWDGTLRHYTACGILMHSSLAVTTEGLPLGLSAAKFWTRKKFKGTNALKKKINPTRVPIEEKESIRWLENLQQSTALLAEPNFAPSFHIINHVVYHTSLDMPELVPAEGMQRSVRAFAAIIDRVNAMTIPQLRGPAFPPKDGRGTVLGPIGM
jgi:hypothetical protein